MKFTFLTGDCNWKTYGGKWISTKYNNGEFDFWFVMSLLNWGDSVGAREAKEVGFTYHVSVCVIAPEQYVEKERALESSGIEQEWGELDDRTKVELIESYAGGAQIFAENGNNFRQLFKAAREAVRESELLFGFAMDRAQNAIGSTGWDFLTGNVLGGLQRYREAGKTDSPTSNLMLKIKGSE